MNASIKILIIEDNVVDRKVLEKMITSSTTLIFELTCVGNLTDSLKHISKEKFDIIISNLGLPDSFGIETFTKLYLHASDIPIIVLTSLDDYNLAIESVKGGAQDYLIKDTLEKDILFRSINYSIERKKVENELRDTKSMYRAVADYTYDWEYWENTDGSLKYVSPACERICGYTAKEITDNPTLIHEMILPEDEKIWDAHKSNHLLGELQTIQFRIKKPNGGIFWIEHRCQPIVDQNNNFIGYRANNRDITKEKLDELKNQKLEQQLRQAQKMETLGTLVGGIAHEFNNILTSILGYAQMCQLSTPINQKNYESLKNIISSTNHAKQLVQSLLTFSRSGDLTSKDLHPINICQTINDAIEISKISLPKSIEIKTNIRQNNEMILGDPNQIHQIIMNLFSNASAAMKEKTGMIEVSSETINVQEDLPVSAEIIKCYPNLKRGKYVRISISDTGCGMDPTIIERIFEPFFTTKEVGKGTGLGLSMVHGIILNHNGEITVNSEVGKGTTFCIYLPQLQIDQIKSTEQTLSRENEISLLEKGSGTILFVDDEKNICTMSKQLLESIGYKVIIENHSLNALEIYRNNPDNFDLVITDQTMPKMTGTELSQKLMEINPKVKIILITGYSESVSKENFKDFGIKMLISKPFDIGILSSAIKQIKNQ